MRLTTVLALAGQINSDPSEQERDVSPQHAILDRHQAIPFGDVVARGGRQAFLVGGETATNVALAEAFASHGCDSAITTARGALSATVGDVILNRLDVLPAWTGSSRASGRWRGRSERARCC